MLAVSQVCPLSIASHTSRVFEIGQKEFTWIPIKRWLKVSSTALFPYREVHLDAFTQLHGYSKDHHQQNAVSLQRQEGNCIVEQLSSAVGYWVLQLNCWVLRRIVIQSNRGVLQLISEFYSTLLSSAAQIVQFCVELFCSPTFKFCSRLLRSDAALFISAFRPTDIQLDTSTDWQKQRETQPDREDRTHGKID